MNYPTAGAGMPPAWRCYGLFASGVRCVAALETCSLHLLANGDVRRFNAIRLVCVAPRWRGRGLFRRLLTHVLARCDADDPAPTLLFAAEDELYRPFGFLPVPQHSFVGATPEPLAAIEPARPLDLPGGRDGAAARLLAARAPVSHRLALAGAPGLFLDRVAAEDHLHLADLQDVDAIVAYRRERDTIVLIDVVAAAIPSLAHILAALPEKAARARVLFPPDLLDWSGAPIPADTGLMARGVLPDAFQQPGMLPPTAEF